MPSPFPTAPSLLKAKTFSEQLGGLVSVFITPTVAGLIFFSAYALLGVALDYLFPVTFTRFLSAVGLGNVSLWQVCGLLGLLLYLLSVLRGVLR